MAISQIQTNSLASGVAGTGPAFSVYLPSNQTITTTTFTKVQLSTESFDTANCFNTTTYRFTPDVAGYYQITGSVYPQTSVTIVICAIYFNGSAVHSAYSDASSTAVASKLIYFNGSTDYIELYAYLQGATPAVYGRADLTFMTGALVRAA